MLKHRNHDHHGGIEMPRKRRQTRAKLPGLESWVLWNANEFREFSASGDPWTRESAREFYDKSKDAVMRAVLEKIKERNNPFYRPREYWEDLEKEHPRLDKEKETCRPYLERVSNGRYLNRLGLLEPWEKEIFKTEKDVQ